jgi:hydrogenase-4 component F
MVLLVLVGAPLLAVALAAARVPVRLAGRLAALLSLVSLGAALVAWRAVTYGEVPTALDGLLRADALSTVLALVVATISALAAWLGPGVGEARQFSTAQVRQYVLFSNLFAFTMIAAVTLSNVGLMWVAIEATTIASAMLIPLRTSKASVEASWKYLLIGSVGIALAFVGTVLAYFDFVHRAGEAAQALNWPVLLAAAPRLHPDVMRLAFVFLLVGYGTKAGLAPMHTWLPDAHSEAPAPLSAMMSGVLLAVALYAIMRWKAVVDLATGSAFTSGLLGALGLLSLVIAAFSLVAQRSYKRMLAYSSIEHTGLTCLGLALGPLGAFAALLHLVNHSLVKSALFLLSGRVHHRYGTTQIAGVSGLLRTMPATGALFAAGLLAAIGHYALMAVVLAVLVLVFISLVSHLSRMLYGPCTATPGERDRLALVPLGACLAAVVILGVTLPWPLARLLVMGAQVVAR